MINNCLLKFIIQIELFFVILCTIQLHLIKVQILTFYIFIFHCEIKGLYIKNSSKSSKLPIKFSLYLHYN